MDVQAIRDAITARIEAVTSVRAYAFPPDQIPTGATTAVVIAPGETYVDFHEAFRGGLAIVNLVVSPYVPMQDPRSAFIELDALLSSGTGETRSLIDALMGSDKTFGGVCHDVVVDDATNVQAISNTEGARYLTCDLRMRVLVGRT